MSEPMEIFESDKVVCRGGAGAGRFEWLVVHSDGYRHSMFGGRFFVPRGSNVLMMIRRDAGWSAEQWQKLLAALAALDRLRSHK